MPRHGHNSNDLLKKEGKFRRSLTFNDDLMGRSSSRPCISTQKTTFHQDVQTCPNKRPKCPNVYIIVLYLPTCFYVSPNCSPDPPDSMAPGKGADHGTWSWPIAAVEGLTIHFFLKGVKKPRKTYEKAELLNGKSTSMIHWRSVPAKKRLQIKNKE